MFGTEISQHAHTIEHVESREQLLLEASKLWFQLTAKRIGEMKTTYENHDDYKHLLEARANSSLNICSVAVLSWRTVFTLHVYLHMDQIACDNLLLVRN